MHLAVRELSLRGFRNLAELSLRPGPHFNVIHGDNGHGKSNLLEAIDYLATLRSFRGATTADLISQGQRAAELRARVDAGGAPREHTVTLSRDASRTVKLDGKRPRSKASYFTSIQMVLFHPGDMQLVAGAPEQRRTFLDRILQQYDTTYASTLQAYEKALRSRNRLLRSDPQGERGRRAIAAYDELMAPAGAVIGKSRMRLVAELTPLVQDAFQRIAGEAAHLRIAYAPRVEPDVEELARALARNFERDVQRGFTADGPHADDLRFELDDTAAKRYGSQGQHRAIVLSLKVAELHELTRRVGRVPILLLDDVSSELDRTRNRRLFSLLAELGGQVFLTTTHPEFILLEHDRCNFHVREGVIEPG